MLKQFGASVNKTLTNRYSKSSNWKNNKFENLVVTEMDINLKTLPGLIKESFKDRKTRSPEKPIPVMNFDQGMFNADSEPNFIWYGHSVLLMKLGGKKILIDPMLGPDAAPIAPFATKRFSDNTLDLIDQLPDLDLIIYTHDHYDHLDLASLQKLKTKCSNFYVALGVGRHLEKWGINSSNITEFDWWDSAEFENIKITFTPSRHFSGRGPFDRAKSLWGGWVFETNVHKIYWSGDGGYGDHFKEVGEKFGSFDIGFMECGQYNWRWHAIHMYPEEAVWAAQDANVKAAIPVHWAGFALAMHHWKDPIERFVNEAKSKELTIATPQIGECFNLQSLPNEHWWDSIK